MLLCGIGSNVVCMESERELRYDRCMGSVLTRVHAKHRRSQPRQQRSKEKRHTCPVLKCGVWVTAHRLIHARMDKGNLRQEFSNSEKVQIC